MHARLTEPVADRAAPLISTAAGDPTRASLVVVGATVAMALGFGALALPAVFMRPLEAEFAWSRGELSAAYAAATAGMAIGGWLWGRASDRIPMRILLVTGAVGMTLGLLAMAAVETLWQLYVANLVFAGFGFAVLYAPLLAAVGERFDRRRGLAIGIVTAGGALGQGLMPFVGNLLIDDLGWRAAFLMLAAVTLIALALTLPQVSRPKQALSATGAAPTAVNGADRVGWRLVALSAAAFLCCVCMGVPLVHLASFVGTICGSAAIGATSLLIAMLAGTVGRICFGLIADRIGNLASYALASAIQTVCVVAYPWVGGNASALALSAVFGFGFAGNMTCLVLCVRDAVPATRFGAAIGVVMLVAWAGMGAGAYAGGLLFDLSLSYVSSFLLAGLAGVLNLGIIGTMIVRLQRRPRRPRRELAALRRSAASSARPSTAARAAGAAPVSSLAVLQQRALGLRPLPSTSARRDGTRHGR